MTSTETNSHDLVRQGVVILSMTILLIPKLASAQNECNVFIDKAVGAYDVFRLTDDVDSLLTSSLGAIRCLGSTFTADTGRLYNWASYSLNRERRYEESVRLLDAYFRQFAVDADSAKRAILHQRSGYAHFNLGNYEQMASEYDEAHRLASALQDYERFYLYHNIAYNYRKAGQLGTALSLSRVYAALMRTTIGEDSSDARLAVPYYMLLINAAAAFSRLYSATSSPAHLDSALAYSREAARLSRANNDPYWHAFAVLAEVEANRKNGALVTAHFGIKMAAAIQDSLANPRLAVELDRQRGLLQIADGNVKRGRTHLIDALRLAEERSIPDMAQGVMLDLQSAYEGVSIAEVLERGRHPVRNTLIVIGCVMLLLAACAGAASRFGVTIVRARSETGDLNWHDAPSLNGADCTLKIKTSDVPKTIDPSQFRTIRVGVSLWIVLPIRRFTPGFCPSSLPKIIQEDLP